MKMNELIARHKQLVPRLDLLEPEGAYSRYSSDYSSPCDPSEIDQAERRLGARLPNEVREFYLAQNGIGPLGHPVYSVFRIEQLGKFSEVSPDLTAIITQGEYEDEEDRYDQYKSVINSIVLSDDVDAGFFLADPNRDWIVGTWTSWNPAMSWLDQNLAQWLEETVTELEQRIGQQGGAEQPATRSQSDSESHDKTQQQE